MNNEEYKISDEGNVIKVKMVYDYETVRDFFRFNILKIKYVFTFIVFIWIITILFYIITALVFFLDGDIIYSSLMLAIIYTSISVAYSMQWFIFPKTAFDSNLSAKNANVEYIFRENDFSSILISRYSTSGSKVRYDALWKVFEIKDTFYLYDSANSGHIVRKSGIQNATVENLRFLLLKNVGKLKYKNLA